MFACGENAANRAERIARPRAARWPEPSRSASLPVGKRASPRIEKAVRSDSVTWTLIRAATSPIPVADPCTSREVESCGLLGVPPQKCAAVGPPNGMISASLVPRRDVETMGSTTPMSTRSSSPKLAKNDVTVMSRSSASRTAITSFSSVGTPYGVQLAPTMLSHTGPVTFSCDSIVGASCTPYGDNAVAHGARDVLVREGHFDILQAHAAQCLKVQAIDVGTDEDPTAAQRLGALV